ncbi:helix-turn-helix domain-containing protein [Knoellia sp. S7-12]|uniref:AraC-like ligand-binding domain-containing protein n=1 Tax=Knoellia sp. S7-12 TaxID=3126698 RepID=UPI00336744A9
MLGHADRTWHTHDIDTSDQFSAWEAMAAEPFAPVTLSRPREDAIHDDQDDPATAGFLTSCAAHTVGDLGVAWLDSGAQRVERSSRQIGQRANGVYFLNLPLAGKGIAVQDGRLSVTRAGDFVLIHGDRPFTLDFESRFEQIAITIPRELMDPLLAEPKKSNCVVVKGDSGAGAIASATIQSLAAQRTPFTVREMQGITTHVVGLIALALSEAVQQSPTPLRVHRFQCILDVVDRRLCDPDLTPTDVARELSISLSYLTKLFAEHGMSFGRTVLARRLDRANALLSLGDSAGSVTHVATACGFHDSAYFSRAYRARFGLTPSERRASIGTSADGIRRLSRSIGGT